MTGILHYDVFYENTGFQCRHCGRPVYKSAVLACAYQCLACEKDYSDDEVEPLDASRNPRVMVARPVDGITLNTALEMLLGDDNEVIVFDNKAEAEAYLLAHGFDAEGMEHMYFCEATLDRLMRAIEAGEVTVAAITEELDYREHGNLRWNDSLHEYTTEELQEAEALFPAATEPAAIRLLWAGENEGYYRTYYRNEDTGDLYALMKFLDVRTWHTATPAGEPDMPLKDGLRLEIVEGGQVICREIISRVNDYTSIGVIVDEEDVA
jgi:hypothetical protein